MLPEGWIRTTIGNISLPVTSGSRGWASYYSDNGSPFIRITNLRKSSIIPDYKNLKFVCLPKGNTEGSRTRLRGGDILISITADLGTIGFIDHEPATESYISQHIARIRVKSEENEPRFIAYQLSTPRHWAIIQRLNDAGAKAGLNLPTIQSIPVVTPPLPEQQRIAEILTTWDEAIETVEALIANARDQKKALMQQLLAGKRRLPGFSGAWTTTTLDNAAQIIVSNVDKKSVVTERPVRLCNYMDVYRSDRIEADMDFMAATAAEPQIRKFGLRVGDVLITKDSETPDDIAIPSFVGSTAPDLVCGYHLAIIRPKKETDGLFLKFYFEHPHTRHFFASRANGATRFGLTIDAIQTAPIALPSLEEQQHIGEVIGAAELEIARLQPIVAALRQEKAALMQQLLTGKRRVIIEKEAACA